MVDLTKVAGYDFAVVVDGSGSMGTKDVKSGWFSTITRWEAARKAASKFAKDLETIDKDGIDLVIFSDSRIHTYPGSNGAKVLDAFDDNDPLGGTPLTEALAAAIKSLEKSSKKKFIIVFTDGEPNNKASVRDLIVKQANSQATDDELTILFIQVGEDAAATRYLQSLDNELKDAKFDIVDVKLAKEAEKFESTLELVVHAIGD